MMNFFRGFAAAAVLVAAVNFPAQAEDAPATPAQAPSEAKPADVPRPSLVPQATNSAPDSAAAAASRRHRRHARHRYRRYAYWEPFPVYFPHLYHNRVIWNRASWFRF